MEISSNSGTDCSHTWRVLVRIIRDEYRVTRFRNKNRWSRLKIKVGNAETATSFPPNENYPPRVPTLRSPNRTKAFRRVSSRLVLQSNPCNDRVSTGFITDGTVSLSELCKVEILFYSRRKRKRKRKLVRAFISKFIEIFPFLSFSGRI